MGGLSLLRHHLGEASEEVTGVVWAGRRLGVVLDAERARVGHREPLDCAVVEVQVGDYGLALQARFVYRKAVVVRSDLDLARGEVLHRLVRATVAELHLVRLPSECESENLMA